MRVFRAQIVLSWLLLLSFGIPGFASENSLQEIEALLKRPLFGTNQSLEEVQAYTEARVLPMPRIDRVREWEKFAKRTREDVLSKVVFRGEAAQWRKEKTKVVWLETIEGGAEYRIRKLRYEAVPGLWIPALLYEPKQLTGKVPVALNVNGHEGVGKSVGYKQIRCINEAKRGMLALNPEWIGMGQLNSTNYQHYRMNQLDLCGTSGLSVFYLAMKRGLDILLDHKNADPERVAVSGLSGGGWQTIFISSLDTRVTLCNPVAGYSSFRTRARFLSDLGDSEQTPCDLGMVTDYAQLTAMLAPHPALLTFNAADNCCFASDHAMEPLVAAAKPIYDLYGKRERLRWHVNHDPGTHNFGRDNREAFYRILGDFFYANDEQFPYEELSCDAEVKSNAVLNVELPSDNANLNSLARSLSANLPRTSKTPSTKAEAQKLQKENRAKLREVLRARDANVTAEVVGKLQTNLLEATFWRLKIGNSWTLPAVELAGHETKGTTILIADEGRRKESGTAQGLLEAGQRVIAIDPFYLGESKIRSHDYLFALLISALGDRPLGIQASQLAAVARWARAKGGPVTLMAVGRRCSTMALAAAALDEKAIDALELHQPLATLKQVIEENGSVASTPELFCFGLLEECDIPQMHALVAPRPVRWKDASPRLKQELADLPKWYSALGGQFPGWE